MSSLREEKCACFFVLIVFGLCAALLSQSSVCPFISISVSLLFFSCNQTHRFISVTLKDHQNQFRTTLPCGRTAVGGHTCTCISFTHTLAETPTWAQHDTHSGANTLAGDSPHHCFLMSYLLHPCNIHLSSLTGLGSSIYPFYLYPRSDSPHRYSQLPHPPAKLTFFLLFQEQEWNIVHVNGCLTEAALSRLTLGTRAINRWSVLSVS